MSFVKTDAQTMLADMAAKLLTAENPFELRRHRLAASPPELLALWPALAEQGILGTAFTEEQGGFGGTIRDLAVLMENIGAKLVVEPVLASAICGRVLAESGEIDELAAVIAGEQVFAFAHVEGFDPFVLPATKAIQTAGGYQLNGEKPIVRHGDIADAFIVSADLNGIASCFLVTAKSAGVSAEPCRLIDSSSAATIIFAGAPAKLLSGADLQEAVSAFLVGIAAEACGIMAALLEATFAYLGTRKQFGATLASFQALQHRAADMFIASEEARVLTDRAIAALDENKAGRFAMASAAKALCDGAGRKIGHEAVQLHGGMGVSDELNVSHYMRRLAAIRAEMGSADIHIARFATIAEG